MNNSPTVKKIAMAIIAIITWVALIMQFQITTGNFTSTGRTFLAGAEFYFSFFTVLTNLLIAICLTTVLIAPTSAAGIFFAKPSVQTAITVYIVIVGLIYNFILRGTLVLTGTPRLVDETLHVIIPLLFLIYWYIFVPARSLQWKDSLAWLLYPGLYLIYALIRGEIMHQYPYPFIDLGKYGFQQVMINSALALAAFLAVSFLFIALNKAKK